MQNTVLEQYSDSGPFNDPVLRCDSCNKLVLQRTILQIGKCPHCGRAKFWKLRTFTSQELAWMKDQDVDPEFLKLFGPVEVAG